MQVLISLQIPLPGLPLSWLQHGVMLLPSAIVHLDAMWSFPGLVLWFFMLISSYWRTRPQMSTPTLTLLFSLWGLLPTGVSEVSRSGKYVHVFVYPELPWFRYHLSITQLLPHLSITSINIQRKLYSQHTINVPIICLGIYCKKIIKDIV